MFGKKVNPADYRIHQRYAARNMSVMVDGEDCTLHDYSDGGVRISSRSPTRRVALIEVFKNGKCVRKSPAIVAWRREMQAGYAFRSNLKMCEIDYSEQTQRAKGGDGEAEQASKGALAPSALRARLRM